MKAIFDDVLYFKNTPQGYAPGERMPLSLAANQVKQTIWLGAKHCGKYVKFLFPLLNWDSKKLPDITGLEQSDCYFLNEFFSHTNMSSRCN